MVILKVDPCIRIIGVDTNTSKVLQDFNMGHIAPSLYYPALSIDKSGNNIGIIFGYSSSDTYPSLLVGSDLVKNNNSIFNSLEYFQFLKNGTANSLSTRYVFLGILKATDNSIVSK